MPHLLQVANVGSITGGTAACAWTVARSLPGFRHTVAFLSRISPETRDAFSGCRLVEWNGVTTDRVAAIRPDVVLLHNTSPARCHERLPVPAILYRHSAARPAAVADLTLYCSRWLARRCGADFENVLWQAVPRPLKPTGESEARALRSELVVGRLCTPTARKWPEELIPFYGHLAHAAGVFASPIRWEFIGCPDDLQPRLREACAGNAAFFPASWQARRRLWTWDALLYHNPHVTESFGRTAAEAMRAGCIPIVDDRGGFREQITPRTGFLCASPEEFAAAMKELGTPTRRREMSRAARHHAEERFSLARFGNDLRTQFRRIVA